MKCRQPDNGLYFLNMENERQEKLLPNRKERLKSRLPDEQSHRKKVRGRLCPGRFSAMQLPEKKPDVGQEPDRIADVFSRQRNGPRSLSAGSLSRQSSILA
ncbi:hypothetical protein BOX30_09205 [Leptospirillum ferriphilum]|nr:hypothetical protein BOX30_09205 [Leptospirillum ferriphilum]